MSETIRIDPTENPEQANAQIAAILNDSAPQESEPKPMMEPPADGQCKLPGLGYTVEVRELTGEDEEALAKVKSSYARWMSTLLERAVVSINGDPANGDAVERLLVGDRDYLLLEIRRVTWGPEIELPAVFCPLCEEEFEAIVHVDDIPIKRLDSPDDATFTVDLREGRRAQVRLPNGTDQAALLDNEKWTPAERNTRLLQRCVIRLIDASGNDLPVAGFPSMVRQMSVPDRSKVLREMDNRAPGAKYAEVTVKHDECGETTAVPIGTAALFPDL